nr:immunoglobulin light chain junction region [Macaca mulatta]
CQQCNTWNTF